MNARDPISATLDILGEPEKRYREREELRQKQTALLETVIRSKCAEALGPIGEAIQSPSISRLDIERAQELLAEALAAARILDPEEELDARAWHDNEGRYLNAEERAHEREQRALRHEP